MRIHSLQCLFPPLLLLLRLYSLHIYSYFYRLCLGIVCIHAVSLYELRFFDIIYCAKNPIKQNQRDLNQFTFDH